MTTPVRLRAELRHASWDTRDYSGGWENVVEEFHIHYASDMLDHIEDPLWRERMRQTYTPARYVADAIAMTRNIAPTWDIVSVTLDDIDVTETVQAAWTRWYVSRRAEFSDWL